MEPAAKPSHSGERPPSRANAKPPTAIIPEPGGPPGLSASTSRVRRRQCADAAENRSGGVASSARTAPAAAIADPPRSGCSKQIHGSPGRRQFAITAVGSTGWSTTAVTLTSRGDPFDRARSRARFRRACRRRCADASIHSGDVVAVASSVTSTQAIDRLAHAASAAGRARVREWPGATDPEPESTRVWHPVGDGRRVPR